MRVKQPHFSHWQSCSAIAILLIIALTACGSSDSESSSAGYVQFYNASKNAPAIFLTLDEDLDESDSDELEVTYLGVEFGDATNSYEIEKGSYFFELAWQDEDSSQRDDLELIHQSELSISNDDITFIAMSESIENPAVHLYQMPVIDDEEDDDNDLFNMRILNMHSGDTGIDVYVSKSDETFNEAILIGQFQYTQLSDNQKLEQDEYIFYITQAGSEEVLFESGEVDYAYSSQYVMIVRENLAIGTSPYALDRMSSSSVIEYLDHTAQAQFSVYNAIQKHDLLPQYQEVFDVHINGITDTPAISTLALGEFSDVLVKDSGDYSVDVVSTNTDNSIISNHLLSLPENSNKTVFFYAKEDDVDEDGDGDVDEDGDGQVDEVEVTLHSLVIDNSVRESIYDHGVTIVNLVDSDDFSQIRVYFVRSDETIDTAFYNRTAVYTKPETVVLQNNTYQVFAVAQHNSSDIILSSFELVLDESSTEQFLLIEEDISSPSGYKINLKSQND